MTSTTSTPATTSSTAPAGGIPAVFMRGGTSKGVIFHERDLPPAGSERDALLMRVMGTPDPLQIDGMGGSTSSTSKVMVIGDPEPDGSVPYSFAQVGIGDPVVDHRGNCGNLTFAVAAFVVDEGIIAVDPTASTETVPLRNVNTGLRIDAEVELRGGRVASRSDTAIAGVPGTSGAITTKYLNPAGAALGKLLPIGEPTIALDVEGVADGELVSASRVPINSYETPGVRHIEASLVDATNPYLFVAREAVPGADRSVAELRTDLEFLAIVERIRACASVACGAASGVDTARMEAPVTPRIVLVSRGTEGADIDAITVSMQQVHRGIPMTGAMCLAAARSIPGSVVERVAGVASDGVTVIRQPLGLTRVTAEVAEPAREDALGRAERATSSGEEPGMRAERAQQGPGQERGPGQGRDGSQSVGTDEENTIRVKSVGITGTARALMKGKVFPRPV